MKPYVHGASQTVAMREAIIQLRAENAALRKRVPKKRRPEPSCKATMTPAAYEHALQRDYNRALASYTTDELMAGTDRLEQARDEAWRTAVLQT